MLGMGSTDVQDSLYATTGAIMPHFDMTISLGSILSGVSFIAMALFAWRDLTWRISNLETWRKEHMIDADARDAIITKMDRILFHLTRGHEGVL